MVDAEAIAALRQSRYCPSDDLAGFAAVELAGLGRGPDLARSVASWVFERLAYEPRLSGPLDTAVDALLDGAATSPDYHPVPGPRNRRGLAVRRRWIPSSALVKVLVSGQGA
jgi:hypothetical protein